MYPSTDGVLTGAELLKRSMDALTGKQPRPADRAFTQFLGGLEAADLCALVTLHYVGRNFQDSDKPEKALLWQSNNMRSSHVADEAFAKLSERRGLDEYLVRGLRRAMTMGLDIEALPLAK